RLQVAIQPLPTRTPPQQDSFACAAQGDGQPLEFGRTTDQQPGNSGVQRRSLRIELTPHCPCTHSKVVVTESRFETLKPARQALQDARFRLRHAEYKVVNALLAARNRVLHTRKDGVLREF